MYILEFRRACLLLIASGNHVHYILNQSLEMVVAKEMTHDNIAKVCLC
jgi:hypothetical protein